MANDPNHIIAALVDLWCDRRDLRPLTYVLPAFTGNNGLTDGWNQLHDDLKNAYAMCTELPVEERELIKKAYIAIDFELRNG